MVDTLAKTSPSANFLHTFIRAPITLEIQPVLELFHKAIFLHQ